MIVALTGGIGSGKSYVCKLLAERGISVYDCDAHAKELMRTSQPLQQQLSALVGEDVFRDGVLQKAILAAYLLQSETHVQAVNAVIHPAVAHDFEQSGQSWLESAILFDSGFDKRTHIDKVVCVTAPEEVRIRRVMARDSISREKTLEWIARQLPQEEVIRRSDYEIINDGICPLAPQVDHLLSFISE
ncbi:dephospho-CoA kinase [Prevotella sp.]|uniref:dephospho-CoA kinase n=1 Tax=Prevotella sp. TaxID=59823 RepID=UPI001CAF5788|nr:dephospho-CoA kinase [Prevotella sp.]MBF1621453.1 dephospho-CoA kinase [Prevotella sp.]